MLHQAIIQATLNGWRLNQVINNQAILSYQQPPRPFDSVAINLILTFITCGMWLFPWLIMFAVEMIIDPGDQILILTQEPSGNITQVVRGGL